MANTLNIADIRINYSKKELSEASISKDPLEQFRLWLDEALQAEVLEPTAVVLSTVDAAGKPSARVMLLKELSAQGFTFFTNYESRKGHEMEQNPHAALTFFWPELERQVRVEGRVVKAQAEVSDFYFQSRPKGSQIGAWASQQSRRISNRSELEQNERNYMHQYAEQNTIPRPAHWGGYVLEPAYIEFWQGRPNRLHDRIAFERVGNEWTTCRLAP
ncbi:pyridoxamine 5'-phosphate oxidase [Botryobacter ruber]|uniref:pyridoxamine 5'-phosphate oxidase n=1 Tax=Botryobacter ruber TaxID=2171629 RepID=UPI000E0C88FF|nr:pyridoxamine 5'-phosphate oxidase [Botryobacter ruber]